MKREHVEYSNVVGGDIYNHYGLFFWKECFFCKKDFRRDSGFRFQMQVDRPWVYSCGDCCSSKEGVNVKVKEWFSNRPRPPSPPEGTLMVNILQFPKRNISTITIDIQTTILEDGSVWYRLTDVKDCGWCEWVKLEEVL